MVSVTWVSPAPVGVIDIDTVHKKHVEAKIERTTKSLDYRHGAYRTHLAGNACLVNQVRRSTAINDTNHLVQNLRTVGILKTQRIRKAPASESTLTNYKIMVMSLRNRLNIQGIYISWSTAKFAAAILQLK